MTVKNIDVIIDFMEDDNLGYYVFLDFPESEGTDDEMKFGSEINPFLNGIDYGSTAILYGAYQDRWDIEKRDGQCGYYFKSKENANKFAELIKNNIK